MNLYTYCKNNPIMYIDPSGHKFTDWDRGNVTSKKDKLKIVQAGGAYNRAKNDAERKAAHDAAEAVRDKYRNKNETGRADGETVNRDTGKKSNRNRRPSSNNNSSRRSSRDEEREFVREVAIQELGYTPTAYEVEHYYSEEVRYMQDEKRRQEEKEFVRLVASQELGYEPTDYEVEHYTSTNPRKKKNELNNLAQNIVNEALSKTGGVTKKVEKEYEPSTDARRMEEWAKNYPSSVVTEEERQPEDEYVTVKVVRQGEVYYVDYTKENYERKIKAGKMAGTTLLGDLYDLELVTIGYDFEENRMATEKEKMFYLGLLLIPGSVKPLKEAGEEAIEAASKKLFKEMGNLGQRITKLTRDEARDAVQGILKKGELGMDDLKSMIPDGIDNTFFATDRIKEGQKYVFELADGQKATIRWHAPDPEAAIKYPGSASGTRWTAQIKIGNKSLGADGKWYKNQSLNIVHIPIEGM